MKIVVLVAAAAYLLLPVGRSCEGENRQRIDRLEAVLVDGDVILRYGNGFWSPFFRDMSRREKRFSHVGIVVRKEAELLVVHASACDVTGAGFVACEPLQDFLQHATDFAVYRLDSVSGVRQRIAGIAMSFVGRRFDPFFELGDASRLYCSELVMHAVNSAAGERLVVPVVVNGHEIVTIDNCYGSSRFFAVADKRQLEGF